MTDPRPHSREADTHDQHLLTRGVSVAVGLALAGSAVGGSVAAGGVTLPPPNPVNPQFTVPPTISVPAASPTASSKIHAAEAWALCRVAATPLFPAGMWTPADFTSASSAPVGPAGSWQVRVGFSPVAGGYGAAVDCTVTGTLGAPIVTTTGPIDFGCVRREGEDGCRRARRRRRAPAR